MTLLTYVPRALCSALQSVCASGLQRGKLAQDTGHQVSVMLPCCAMLNVMLILHVRARASCNMPKPSSVLCLQPFQTLHITVRLGACACACAHKRVDVYIFSNSRHSLCLGSCLWRMGAGMMHDRGCDA
jgi:hypothetical protein